MKFIKRNAKLGNSLIDYLFHSGGKDIYVEVKSAAQRNGNFAQYPDCPSIRGQKHIRELTEFAGNEGRAIVVFIAAAPDVRAFKPNCICDPEICRLLIEALDAGVEIKSISMYYDPEDESIQLSDADLRVEL